ncbi:MAG: hypothetical protein ACRCW6_00430 [Mycoplasmoidaceae bacterium]
MKNKIYYMLQRSFFSTSTTTIFLGFAVFLLIYLLNKNNGNDILKNINGILILIPIILASVVGLIFQIFYAIWRTKEYEKIKNKLKTKIIFIDYIATFIFFVSVFLINIMSFLILFKKIYFSNKQEYIYIIILIILGLFLLISEGMHKYFLYKIKISIVKMIKHSNDNLISSQEKNLIIDKDVSDKNKNFDNRQGPEVSAGDFYGD